MQIETDKAIEILKHIVGEHTRPTRENFTDEHTMGVNAGLNMACKEFKKRIASYIDSELIEMNEHFNGKEKK